MKHLFYKIISLGLALVVLLSTMSFAVAKHYCGSLLIDVSLYTAAKTCGVEAMTSSYQEEVPLSFESKVLKRSCCKDENVMHQGQDELQSSWESLDSTPQLWGSFFTYYNTLFEGWNNNNVPFQEYRPPLLFKDLQLLNVTFLI